jgi:hypothetical protein
MQRAFYLPGSVNDSTVMSKSGHYNDYGVYRSHHNQFCAASLVTVEMHLAKWC